jgi:hypothetical protein
MLSLAILYFYLILAPRDIAQAVNELHSTCYTLLGIVYEKTRDVSS